MSLESVSSGTKDYKFENEMIMFLLEVTLASADRNRMIRCWQSSCIVGNVGDRLTVFPVASIKGGTLTAASHVEVTGLL